ncbi:MAG: 30S ribosomal protein S26e [Candidatus Thorarchaeota archaeon]|nr:30S ribosomal protein S26e [Candidatus Thorarchaeota archaeon]
MAKKRKSSGRSKGGHGKSDTVQCTACGRVIPSDKAKKFTKRTSAVDPQLARELRQQGSYIQTKTVTQYYCISCAVSMGKIQIRSDSERKPKPRF